MRSASAESTSRPVSRISNAREVPMALGSRKLTPSSLAVRPLLMPAARNRADSAAIRMSAPRLRHMPPPIAGPFTAAITGWGIDRRASTRSDRYSMALTAMPDSPSPSIPGGMPESSRSAPAQNPRPVPVSTTTQVLLSAATVSMASRNGTTRSNDIAFMRSGRLRVIWATWGRGYVTSTSAASVMGISW